MELFLGSDYVVLPKCDFKRTRASERKFARSRGSLHRLMSHLRICRKVLVNLKVLQCFSLYHLDEVNF